MSHEKKPNGHDNEKQRSFLSKLAMNMVNVPVTEVVPPIYRLGDGKKSEEMILGGCRVLSWNLTGDEKKLSDIAGWNKLSHHLDEELKGYLFLPEGTRNARSVLAGLEAYTGEKSAIVEAAAEYLRAAKATFGNSDTGFSWESLAVTPDHDIFVAPPHTPGLQSDAAEVVNWKSALENELALLLESDATNRSLLPAFHEALKEG